MNEEGVSATILSFLLSEDMSRCLESFVLRLEKTEEYLSIEPPRVEDIVSVVEESVSVAENVSDSIPWIVMSSMESAESKLSVDGKAASSGDLIDGSGSTNGLGPVGKIKSSVRI